MNIWVGWAKVESLVPGNAFVGRFAPTPLGLIDEWGNSFISEKLPIFRKDTIMSFRTKILLGDNYLTGRHISVLFNS